MHRCLADGADWAAGRVVLSAAEAHHVLHVLRAREGDRVVVTDGRGRETAGCLELAPDGACAVAFESPPAAALRLAVRVTLFQAIPKAPRMDGIVEKATELGAAAIVPLLTERVVVRLDPARAADRVERWRRIARSAAKQCGTPWIPDVGPVLDFGAGIARARSAGLFLVGALTPEARPLRAVLRACAAPPADVALLVGPEGDLAPGELAQAVAAGAVPVSFGPLVLRADTAALFGLGALLYEWAAAPAGR